MNATSKQEIMPALFVSHGSPMVAIRSGPYQDALANVGQALAPLRPEGVLILGSGRVVHNLRLVHFEDIHHPVEPWAAAFDAWFRDALQQNKLSEPFNFREAAPHADPAVPTFDHFAPVFVVLGAASGSRNVSTIYEGFEHGNISMRSFAIK